MPRHRRRTPAAGRAVAGSVLWGVLGVLVSLMAVPKATAQYFGQNSVRWEDFDFQVMETEHFDIYYYPEEKPAVELAARMAERWYTRLETLLGFPLPGRQPLILYAAHPHFEQTNTLGSRPGEGVGGVTESFKRRIVMPFTASLAETNHVLGHELVHAFQYSVTGQGRPTTSGVARGIERLPLWFIEGMAEYLSVGPVDPHTAMWMRDAARREELPTVSELGGAQFFPYRWGQALFAYIGGRWGDETIAAILSAAAGSGSAESALEGILQVSSEDLSKGWHAAILETYRNTAAGRRQASDYGEPLITEESEGGELNVAPALSPGGDRLAFLSEKTRFSIELFVADARTGEVQQRLSETATDPHFDSLQFIGSAGAWHPSGERIAIGAVSKGQPVLAVIDADSGERVHEESFPGLGEIVTPTWSPDGRAVAFTAVAGGLSDLYLYDLETRRLRRLTEDAFADLQPAWSPDGGRIAFVSDRFSTDLGTLAFGNYRLAVVDVASGKVRPLPSFDGAKNINPQWASGGEALFFLSDRGGVTNVYRLDTASGELRQVTDLVAGVSGITALSPALASASQDGRVVFSAYEDGGYDLYAIESKSVLAGGTLSRTVAQAGVLPGGRPAGQVARLQDRPGLGLPGRGEFPTEPYDAGLSLDYVGQPYVAIGADRFGSAVGGGTTLFFSDMLGNHQLATALQVQGSFDDISGLVAYENRSSRTTWGGSAQQIPFVTGQLSRAIVEIEGQEALVEETRLSRQTERRLAGVAAYPFSRAFRVEAYGAFRNIGFSREQELQAVSLSTGELLIDRSRDLDAPSAINLGEAGAALVYDTSLFGATSPILGRRFRVEAAPTFGSLQYTGVLADFRQYLMPVRPYTLAFRVLHYGRYGGGGDDSRLSPLFVGYANLVRGYDVSSFDPSECGDGMDGTCPVFDRLVGSKILVGNAELRFPLFGAFGADNLYGPVPIELGVFADTGVAWSSGRSPSLFGGEVPLSTSVGATARLNAFGYAVLQLDYVRPLDRDRGWLWQFRLSPGF